MLDTLPVIDTFDVEHIVTTLFALKPEASTEGELRLFFQGDKKIGVEWFQSNDGRSVRYVLSIGWFDLNLTWNQTDSLADHFTRFLEAAGYHKVTKDLLIARRGLNVLKLTWAVERSA